MKKIFAFLLGISMILSFGSAQATDLTLPFTYLNSGAFSYDHTGANVVTSGNSFYDMITTYPNLGIQRIWGDGIDNPVVGNFAMFAELKYNDIDNVLGWAAVNGDQQLSIELGVLPFDLYTTINGTTYNFTNEYFVLDSKDIPGSLLTTFNQLASPGYTELASDIWMDAWIDTINETIAVSVVIDGYTNDKFVALGNLVNFTLSSGTLDPNPTADHRGSGIRADVVPEPTTAILFGIGILGLAGVSRRKK